MGSYGIDMLIQQVPGSMARWPQLLQPTNGFGCRFFPRFFPCLVVIHNPKRKFNVETQVWSGFRFVRGYGCIITPQNKNWKKKSRLIQYKSEIFRSSHWVHQVFFGQPPPQQKWILIKWSLYTRKKQRGSWKMSLWKAFGNKGLSRPSSWVLGEVDYSR